MRTSRNRSSATLSELQRVETERMVLERMRAEHLDELCALLMHPLVLPTLWPFATPLTRDRVDDLLRVKLEHWRRHGFGYWLARDRASGQMLGRGGLQLSYAEALNAVEAGWAIVPERWGQGLGTEMARAAIATAFGTLELPEVVAFTLPANVASRRIMEKTGFRYEREITHAGLPHVLYRLARPVAAGAVTLR